MTGWRRVGLEREGSQGSPAPGRRAGTGTTGKSPTGRRSTARRTTRRRVPLVFALLIVLLVAALLVSSLTGQFPVPPDAVFRSILRGPSAADPIESALWHIRFPRLALGVVVGAALGVAGAVMQGVFANPLAEPAVVGVSAGSAVGACTAIVLGLSMSATAVPAAAFIGGLGTTFLVYALSLARRRSNVLVLVLTGIAVNAVANAVIAFLVFAADPAGREQIVFWQLGSLNGASWRAVAVTAPMAASGIVVAALIARQFDLFALGERAAGHLGVDVERLRFLSILVVAVLSAAAVSFAGIIGFVGLIVPHVLRLMIGPLHRTLIPASAIGGALLVVSADVIARTLVPFADLPIGMFTALVGGPIFLVLLRRSVGSAR